MATLTAGEITYIRMMTGDNCPDYDVSDEFMQYLHDEKANTAPLCMSGDSLGGTRLWVMRARVARASKLFDEDGEGGAGSVSQKYDHLVAELERMEKECGLGGGIITVSTFSLGLDARCENQYASYYSRWSWGGYL